MKRLNWFFILILAISALQLVSGCQNKADNKDDQKADATKLIGKWHTAAESVDGRNRKIEIRFSDAKITKLVLVEGRNGKFGPKESKKSRDSQTYFFRVTNSNDGNYEMELADNPEFEGKKPFEKVTLKLVDTDKLEWQMDQEKLVLSRQ